MNKGLHLRFSNWTSITWSPTLKNYLLVGHPMYIGQSQNGILWEYQHNPTQKPLMKIRWNSVLGHYIAVGKQGAIAISHDGKDWNAYEIEEKPNLNHILWCVKKKHYVLIGEEGYIALSLDGIHWEKQSCPISGNLFDIATSVPWDEKLLYVVISREDYIIESEDGLTWTVAVKPQQFLPRGARSVLYNHSYGLTLNRTGSAYLKFFTVTANSGTAPGYLHRWYRYYNTKPAPYTSTWVYNQIYIKSPSATNLFSGVNEFHWFEEIKLYVGVAEVPWIFYNDGISSSTLLHNKTNINSDEIKHAFQPGFCSITIGNIPEYKSDEETLYLDLAKYR
ncbi:beta propeller repeat protein [Rickettsiella massiliensis]|uniref:hypothetical protein n=1 Tax=Rickettsiella massiliensis TaxID=676517 RepID=UPI00029B49DC|nr:hypothetical protein [Rickettsiella massiliensis]